MTWIGKKYKALCQTEKKIRIEIFGNDSHRRRWLYAKTHTKIMYKWPGLRKVLCMLLTRFSTHVNITSKQKLMVATQLEITFF